MEKTKFEKVLSMLQEDERFNIRKVDKNNTELTGIELNNKEPVKGILYLEKLLSQETTLSEEIIIERIYEELKIASENKPVGTEIFKKLSNEEFLKEHLYITLERKNISLYNKFYRRPFFNLEVQDIDRVLTVMVHNEDSGSYSIRLPREIELFPPIKEDTLWNYAEINTIKDTKVQNFMDILNYSDPVMPQMKVISNTMGTKGAGAIVNIGALISIADEWNCEKLILIPSSIHEWIIMQYPENKQNFDECGMRETIADVNENYVDDDEILSYYFYVFDALKIEFQNF